MLLCGEFAGAVSLSRSHSTRRDLAAHFPGDTPTEGIDVHKLAKLSVAGGNIRNIAMNAAF